MENNQTLEQYIATAVGGKIVRKTKSPLLGVLLLAAGVALLVGTARLALADGIMMLILVGGIACSGVGLVLTGMTISGALSHYVWQPTRSIMSERWLYLSAADYAQALAALRQGNAAPLGSMQAVVSSNSALRCLVSADRAAAIVQAGVYDSGHFVPEMQPVVLSGMEIAAISMLCK